MSELVEPKRRRWRIAALAAAVMAVVSVVWLVAARRPEPLRVLIAVDLEGKPWSGSRPAVVISDQLTARLVQFGFEPVDLKIAETRATLERADSLEAAAKKLRASFLITASLKPSLEVYAQGGGHVEARVEGPIELVHRDEPAMNIGKVSAFSAAPTKERALEQLGEQLADRIFDVVVVGLIEHESIKKLTSGPDAAVKGRLSRATGFVARRQTRLDEARRAYDNLKQKRLAEEHGPVKPTYHGPLDRSIGLCGAGAKGALLKSSEVSPFFLPDKSELVPLFELERLFWLTPDGTERELFRGYHIAGYPSAAPEGAPIVLVESLSSFAKALVSIDAKGQPTTLRVERERVLADPKLSPDGRKVALWDRPCSGCPAGVLVLALPSGKELFQSDGRLSTLGGFSWLSAERLAFLERPPPLPPVLFQEATKKKPDKSESQSPDPSAQRLVVLDLSTSPATRETLYTTAGETLSAPAATRDGQKLFFARRGADSKELAAFDLASKQMQLFDVGAVSDPAVSPNGDAIAFERQGEIALYELPSGPVRVLTNNPFTDRYPMFSADGKRVLFESRDEDPIFARRMLSVLASVPVR